jgi:Arc/MetJ-type ribon-helix-helix transcriptional regulator
MKKPSKTVSVQLPTDDIEALESLVGSVLNKRGDEWKIKRLSDAIRFAMSDVLTERKIELFETRVKVERAAAAKAKREAKKAEANGI